MIRVLTPFVYTQDNPKYRFLLLRDVSVDVGRDLGNHTFTDELGVVRVEMKGSVWTVKAGYAWDGSSPKFRVFGKWVGTPDFEASRLASLIHDTAWQFISRLCFPLKMQETNYLFGHVINRDGTKMLPAFVYAGAVTLFGRIHYGIGSLFGNKRISSCLEHP